MIAWPTTSAAGWLRAFSVWLALAVCAQLSHAEEVAPPPAAPFTEEEPAWLPHLTLPHPDSWEQLWQPGDLVNDTYWLQRPWSAGILLGTMDGGQLQGNVDQATDWFWGLRVGNDFAPHWGWEFRSAFFSPNLHYTNSARIAQADDWLLDMSVLHYPWGDTRIRPFWLLGLGAAQFKFQNAQRVERTDWVVDMPIGIGCKYHANRWLVLRGDLTDTICFANENINTQHMLSLSIGAEIHWHSFKTLPVKYGY
ncbi:MAG TPA: hypothetical protein VL096_12300 [Pirellulaceae bacterium]|nr:hypothetical protein [Pirellulaceae bacterium]